jgi:hypothetical protein
MDLNPGTARYSTDELAPVMPTSRSEREEAALLPDSSLTGLEKSSRSSRKLWIWSRLKKASIPLLASLAVFSTLLALVGWILYWRSLAGWRLAGEINGLVPECKGSISAFVDPSDYLAADRRWYPVPVKPVVFQDDPLPTPDHKTAESANATYEYWVSFMVAHVDAAWFGD